MKKETYWYGKEGVRWGQYNFCRNEWLPGVDEPTPALADARLRYLTGPGIGHIGVEVRQLPDKKQRKAEEAADTERLKSVRQQLLSGENKYRLDGMPHTAEQYAELARWLKELATLRKIMREKED